MLRLRDYYLSCYQPNREPETVFVPQFFVPEIGQSWQRVGCLFFMASRAHDFHCSTEKRCGKLGRYVYFNKIHVLYVLIM